MTGAQILGAILECKEKMGASMKASFFSLTEAKYAAGDTIRHTVFGKMRYVVFASVIANFQVYSLCAGHSDDS